VPSGASVAIFMVIAWPLLNEISIAIARMNLMSRLDMFKNSI
jgi:hypothetical protein